VLQRVQDRIDRGISRRLGTAHPRAKQEGGDKDSPGNSHFGLRRESGFHRSLVERGWVAHLVREVRFLRVVMYLSIRSGARHHEKEASRTGRKKCLCRL